MNKNNNNTQSGGVFTKIAFLTALILGAVTGVWALPGTGSTNLQTTAGVTTAVLGSELTITAPNKSVLTWQAFGSGTNTVGAADTLNYVLPSSTSSVLNIVAGGASTVIDGYLNSNGNVFILNPQGVLIGGGARFELNKLVVSTSDNPAFATYFFQQNGELPSQRSLVAPAGDVSVNGGAVFAVTENITINARNVDVKGLIAQSGLTINADGNVSVGSLGLTYLKGNLEVNNNGTTVLGSPGNNLIVTENITTTGTAAGTFNAVGAANIQAKSLTVTGGTLTVDRVNAPVVNATGTNVTVSTGFNVTGPVVNVTGNGTVNVTSPGSLTANVTNTGNGTTTVNSAGALTLGKVQVETATGASFTGSSITDTTNRLFVYGPASFTATNGNITVNKGNHSFGPVSVAATGDVTLVEDAALNLNVVNAAKFTARSTDYVFQTPTTGVINSANNTITATGNITLGNTNNVAGNYTLTGKDVVIANGGAITLAVTGNNVAATSTGAVTLGTVLADGTLGVTSAGTITQSADTKVQATGATSFTGTGLTLTNAGNNFGGLAVDVTAAGTATITEDTTLNLTALRAATVTLKSLASIITTGTNPVAADTFSVVAGADFIPAANFRAVNPLGVVASGAADLSLLSLATNLNSKAPTVVAASYKAPAP